MNTIKRVLFFRDIAKLVTFSDEQNIMIMPFSFIRTREEQERLVKAGRSKNMNSKHLEGLAIDFVIIDNQGKTIWDYITEYDMLADYWENLGHRTGRNFKFAKDIYHFEYNKG